jgi:hypothetical protein
MTEKLSGNHEPVIAPGEAWHLGRMDALLTAARLVGKQARLKHKSLLEMARVVDSELTTIANQHLASYYQSAGQLNLQEEPITVVFDSQMGVPVLCRSTSMQGGWGIVDLADDAGGDAMMLATPFRATNLDALPSGTQIIKIRSPAHSALAAVLEVLTCMRRDLDVAAHVESEAEGMRRAARLRMVYTTAASFALRGLDDDDFTEWRATVPVVDDIALAPQAIADTTIKARAQAALALQLCALWLDGASQTASNAKTGTRMAQLKAAVDAATRKMEPLLHSMNRYLSDADPAGYDHMVIMRHGGGSLPVLAVIPRKEEKKPIPIHAGVMEDA